MTQRNRRRLRIFGVILLILAGLYFIATTLVAPPFLRKRLQAMVASTLNAELRIGSLSYHFPYRITVTDAALVTHKADSEPIELLKARSVDLRLAELPRAGKPLVIEQLLFGKPELHFVKLPAGVVGETGLVKDDHRPPDEPKPKPSDMFRLRRFAAESGRVVYEDRTKSNVDPVVWSGLHLDLQTVPERDGQLYRYHLKATDANVASATASGSFDIDQLHLAVDNYALDVRATPDGAGDDKLPAPLQQLLRDNHVRGELKLTGNADLPFHNMPAARFNGSLALNNAAAQIPEPDISFDRITLNLQYATQPLATDPTSQPTTAPTTQPSLYLKLNTLDVGSGDTRLVIEKALAQLDYDSATWRVRDLLGAITLGETHDALPTQLRNLFDQIHLRGRLQLTAAVSGPLRPPPGVRAVDALQYEIIAIPRGLSFHAPTFAKPFEKLSGTIHLQPNLVRLENLSAQYGSDRLFVTTARLPLADLKNQIRFEEIDGSVDFAGNDEPYPKGLGKVLNTLHPAGHYTIAGLCVVRPKEPKRKLEYHLDIAADSAALAPSPKCIPLTAVRGDCKIQGVTGGEITTDLLHFQANAFEGTLTGVGRLKSTPSPTGSRLTYEGRAHAAELNVQAVAKAFAPSGEAPQKASGRGFLDTDFSGTGAQDNRTPADNFRAAGEFEVLDGDFWQLAVLSDVASRTKTGSAALTVGQAAATFQIADKLIDLKNAAVSAPVLGLQGSGQIDLSDGRLNLRVVAAPLADWKDKLKSTNIPLISDAVGEVAGGIQKLLNTATRNLLYEFKITGDVKHPEFTTVPAPVLTKAAAQLFGGMLSAKPSDHLLDQLRPKKPETK